MSTLPDRVIRELRTSPLPVCTGDLARLCAWGMPHAVQQTNAVMRQLLRLGVVVRHKPIAREGGRPAWRWSLRSNASKEAA